MDLAVVIVTLVTTLGLAIAGAWVSIYPSKKVRPRYWLFAFFCVFGTVGSLASAWKGYEDGIFAKALGKTVSDVAVDVKAVVQQTKQPPVINLPAQPAPVVNVPPQPVQIVQVPTPVAAKEPAPDPEIALFAAAITSIGGDEYQVRVALKNVSETSTQASLKFSVHIQQPGQDQVVPINVASTWLMTKDQGADVTHRITLQETHRNAIAAGSLLVIYQATAEYEVRKGLKRYLFEGVINRDMKSLSVIKNQAEMVTPPPKL